MDTNSYVAFLLMGVAFVLIDGQILYRSGLGYLHKVYPAGPARSVMQLVTVLFHLVMLGMLALISTIGVSTGMPVRDLVVRLGIVLLALAAAHGLTMAVVVWMRDRRREERVEDELAADRAGGVNVQPATGRETGTFGPSSGRSPYPT
jgi:hypothetical protein